MSLKIRRNNTSILDTFNDEDIQKEYDNIKLAIIADDIYEAYEIYQKKKDYEKDIYFYKPKSLKALKDWIHDQNDDIKVLDVRWIDVSDMSDLRGCFSNSFYLTEIKGIENWDVRNVKDMSYMF